MVELELRDMLHLDVMTVTGKTLGENLEDLEKENFFQRNLGYLHNYGLEREQVIFPVEKAREKGSVAILRGNLAPDGAVIKYSACTEDMRERKGPARVFNCEEDAYQAVVDKKVAPGDMLIIRYEGPRGSGMPEMLMTTEAIVCDEERKVFRCDQRGGYRSCFSGSCGRRSSGFCRGRGYPGLQCKKPEPGYCRNPGRRKVSGRD